MQKIISLSFFLLFYCLCGPFGKAYAETAINDQGALTLKGQVQDTLQWRLDAAKTNGQGLVMDGDLQVIPQGSFYEVTLPNLSLSLGPKGKLAIGTVTIHVTPGRPGEWLMDLSMPASMTFFDGKSSPAAYITFGRQHLTGNWWPDKDMYSKLDSLYQDIQIKSAGAEESAVTGKIDSLKAVLNMEENGDGTWSGSNNFEFLGVHALLSGKNAAEMSVRKISSAGTYEKLEIAQTLAVKKKFQAIVKSGRQPTPEENREFLDSMLSTPQGLVDAMNSLTEVSGFSVRETTAAEAAPKEVSFETLSIQASAAGVRQEKSVADFKTRLAGLKASFVPAPFAGMLPRDINTEVSFGNLPVKKILEALYGALRKSADLLPPGQAADEAKQAAAQVEMKAAVAIIPKVLQEAGAFLTVQNTFVDSADIRTDLSGRIEATPGAVTGATGKMTLSVKGLDETIQKLQAAGVKPDADPKLMGYVGGMTIFQMMGQPDKAPDGKPLRRYDFELSPDGQVLLNGADVKLLAAGMGKNKGTEKNTQPSAPVK